MRLTPKLQIDMDMHPRLVDAHIELLSILPYHTAQERRLHKRINLPIGQGYYQARHGRVYRMMATGRGMERRYVKGCVGCKVANRVLGWLPKGVRKGVAGVVVVGLAWVAGVEVAR